MARWQDAISHVGVLPANIHAKYHSVNGQRVWEPLVYINKDTAILLKDKDGKLGA